jgi:ribosomal protein S27AE
MAKDDRMVCADCGVLMNHHAEKIDYTAALDDPQAIDPQLGGVLEEVYTCPHCGKTEMRKAVQLSTQG